MGIELRLPNISGSEREQLVQMRSYLYQLVPQLQWALNAVNTTTTSDAPAQKVVSSTSVAPVNAEITFDKLKPLIIKSADIVEAYYEEINKRLESLYVAESDFGTFMEKTAQDIEATSTYVDQKYENVQVIISDEVDGLRVSFQDDMDNLNTTVETIETNVTTIDNHVKEVYGHIEGINAEVKDVANLTTDLNDAIIDVDEKIKNTKTIVEETTGTVEGLKGTTEEIANSIGSLNASVEDANKDIANLKVSIVEATAHIRSGILFYDENEIPVYGLEIGQKNTVNGVEVFNKYARFTSDRLSFYDQNDTEVAYVSDKKLYITNIEITGTFRIGRFVDTVMPDDGSVVTKWI